MKFLRHSPLFIWSVLALGGGALILVALSYGSGAQAQPVVTVNHREAAVTMRHQAAQLSMLAAHPTPDVSSWAQQTFSLADRSHRDAEAAFGPEHHLTRAWGDVADEVMGVATGREALGDSARRFWHAVDNLSRAVSVHGGSDLLGPSVGSPIVPTTGLDELEVPTPAPQQPARPDSPDVERPNTWQTPTTRPVR